MAHRTHSIHEQPKPRSSFGWGWLFIGILFIVAAALSFANPTGNLEALAYAFAFLAIMNGIWTLSSSMGSTLRILGGIVDIIIGIVIFANIFVAIVALPFLFAIWFIVDSVIHLMNIGITRLLGNTYFWLSLILNILGIIVGIMLLFDPITAAFTLSFLVGFYLMLAGIECVAMAFARR